MNTITRELKIGEELNIPGLVFRHYKGEEDFQAIVDINMASQEEDQLDEITTLSEITHYYTHLVNSDLEKDLFFVEVNGEAIGFYRVLWSEKTNPGEEALIYGTINKLVPEWRNKGIREVMLQHSVERRKEIARTHTKDLPRFLRATSLDTELEWMALLNAEDYQPVRYFIDMLRPLSLPVPEPKLPEGIEVRPVKPEHYRQIWDASREAFQDHWGYQEQGETEYKMWIEDPDQKPELWMVGWDGDEVAGMVENFVNEEDNEAFDRKRGWTDPIFVRRPWRKKGLATALLQMSMRMFKDMGYDETALGVDTNNPSGALGLYEKQGYRQSQKVIIFHKEMEL